jgi:hypothetical protein
VTPAERAITSQARRGQRHAATASSRSYSVFAQLQRLRAATARQAKSELLVRLFQRFCKKS